MTKGAKRNQIVVRFNDNSFKCICECADMEHRGLGEFVRHATLYYIETINERKKSLFGRRAEDHEKKNFASENA